MRTSLCTLFTSHAVGRVRRAGAAPTVSPGAVEPPRGRRSAAPSKRSSPPSNIALACSCAPLARRGPLRRSASPRSPAISPARQARLAADKGGDRVRTAAARPPPVTPQRITRQPPSARILSLQTGSSRYQNGEDDRGALPLPNSVERSNFGAGRLSSGCFG